MNVDVSLQTASVSRSYKIIVFIRRNYDNVIEHRRTGVFSSRPCSLYILHFDHDAQTHRCVGACTSRFMSLVESRKIEKSLLKISLYIIFSVSAVCLLSLPTRKRTTTIIRSAYLSVREHQDSLFDVISIILRVLIEIDCLMKRIN